jgi:nicotinate-nucleotide adenylyltransferase
MKSRARKSKPASKRAVRKRAIVRGRAGHRKRAASAARIAFPIALPGMRIGLFGGTFNPPHDAHRAASLLALKRLGLDRVWWLVTPGNPLKENRALPPLAQRIAESRKMAAHPAIEVTGIESALHTRFTYDTVKKLQARFPEVRFVFIIGADNLAGFHRWKNWRALANMIPIAVVDRPDYDLSALATPAAASLVRARIDEREAPVLSLLAPPAWVFLHGLKSELSSTALRAVARSKRRKG